MSSVHCPHSEERIGLTSQGVLINESYSIASQVSSTVKSSEISNDILASTGDPTETFTPRSEDYEHKLVQVDETSKISTYVLDLIMCPIYGGHHHSTYGLSDR